MNIIRRDAADRAVEPLFESKEVKREPIIRTPAKLRVGLRWDRGARADIDLYAKTIGAKRWIYFGEPETPEGRFYKYEGDPTKPSKGFEYIEFNDVVDLKQVMIAINFYDGNIPGGPRGQIRLDIGGVIHEVDFQLRSSYGNKGLGFPDKMVRNPAWVVVNAADIAAGKLSFAGPGP
jgi:hypothetical protein